MRISKPEVLTHDQAMKIEKGYPLLVRKWAPGKNIEVRSLKTSNRYAYDAHLVEIKIGEEKSIVNIEDLKQALRYV